MQCAQQHEPAACIAVGDETVPMHCVCSLSPIAGPQTILAVIVAGSEKLVHNQRTTSARTGGQITLP